MKRFYYGSGSLDSKDTVVLTDTEHNHLAHVLRLRVGDGVIAVCGDEFDYQYIVTAISKNKTELQFVAKCKNQCNPREKFIVYIAQIKYENLSVAVSKLNELGASEIVVFNSANCNSTVKIDKLKMVAEQSCKQCGRSIPVVVRGVLSFADMLNELPDGAVFADENVECGRIEGGSVAVIGCEGGFTKSERAALNQICTPVTLGRRILRAETAAIALSSVLLNKMGEL